MRPRLYAILTASAILLIFFVVIGKGTAAIFDEKIGTALKGVGNRYGLVVEYDAASFVSPTGVSVSGVRVSLPDRDPFLRLGSLKAGLDWVSYLAGRPFVTSLSADDVELVVRQEADGTWEVTRIRRRAVENAPGGRGAIAWPLEVGVTDITLTIDRPSDSSTRTIDEIEGTVDVPLRSFRLAMEHDRERAVVSGETRGVARISVEAESVGIGLLSAFTGRTLDLSTATATLAGGMELVHADEWFVRFEGTLDGLAVNHAILARGAAEGISFGYEVDLYRKGGTLLVRQASVGIGSESVALSGTVARRDGNAIVNLAAVFDRFRLGPAVDAIPRSLLPHLPDLAVTGEVNGEFSFFLDTARPPSLDYKWKGSVESFAILATGPEVDVAGKRDSFLYVAHLPGGETRAILVGPRNPNFVPISAVPAVLVDAVLTAEDGGFFAHKGFSPRHMRDAIVENLEAGRIVRGASTLSMQLAKNLFLSRERTLSRKIEEAFLTLALEQELEKRRMLEIYLNIIEWGPDVFGIGPAARYYFQKPASQLDAVESAFLASIIARPTRRWGQKPLETVGEGWWTYLRVILCKMYRRGNVDIEVLKEAGVSDTALRQVLAESATSGEIDAPLAPPPRTAY